MISFKVMKKNSDIRAAKIPSEYVVFLKDFFLMWTTLKVFIEFATTLLLFYVLVFWQRGMWDLPSLIGVQHTPPAVEGEVSTTGSPGKSLKMCSNSCFYRLIYLDCFWFFNEAQSKLWFFPAVMYGCESWTIKEAERQRIDALELWCWRRLLRVLWTARRSNWSILKEIKQKCSLEGLMLKLQYFGHLM